MSLKHINIPIFIPHKGCPYDCIYCNQKNISGQHNDITITKMKEIIQEYISLLPQKACIEIAFFGGSFTGLDKKEQFKFLETANEYLKSGVINGIRLSTRPDYINNEILDYLKSYNVSTIELGVQSLDDEVLKMSFRGHGVKEVYEASKLIREYGFKLGIQTMVGLPKDNTKKALYTAERVVELLPDMVRIYPTLVIKDTYLEKMYNEGCYTPLDLEKAVEICAMLLGIYQNNNINVIRIGLQPTDNINEGKDVIAGPFHPAFRQMVESKLALNFIENEIQKKGLYNKDSIIINTSKKKLSNVIGQKKSNVEYLRRKYNYKLVSVTILEDEYELYDVKY
ncbi:UNVERIFIED_CONTAM: Histone acetyltransferase [Acetivibrio alkalicellulosi]